MHHLFALTPKTIKFNRRYCLKNKPNKIKSYIYYVNQFLREKRQKNETENINISLLFNFVQFLLYHTSLNNQNVTKIFIFLPKVFIEDI